MKKIFFTIFFSLILLSSVSFSFAQEVSPTGDMGTSSRSAQNKSVEYTLPYPGLLADSPLYFLKILRDKFQEVFISSPSLKADFYLLQADKRLYEGKLLFDKGTSKYSLSESTISKAENYFEKGISQLQIAKNQKLDVNSLIQKYRLSSAKHEEVVRDMIGKSSGNVKSGLSYSQKRILQLRKTLTEFKL